MSCVRKKRLRFCGECDAFPCKVLEKYTSHGRYGNQPEFARIERCREPRAALVRQTREGINPVSVCGHHCDYCVLAQWYGGGRSDYNCCSFAGLFDDHKFRNVEYAAEKGLDGCCACEALECCAKGCYSRPDESVAKAIALFIQTYGQERYASVLKRAIDNGVHYPKDFDACGSVAGALALLERYRDHAVQDTARVNQSRKGNKVCSV